MSKYSNIVRHFLSDGAENQLVKSSIPSSLHQICCNPAVSVELGKFEICSTQKGALQLGGCSRTPPCLVELSVVVTGLGNLTGK